MNQRVEYIYNGYRLLIEKNQKPKLTIIFNWFKRSGFKNKNLSFGCKFGLKIQFDFGLILALNCHTPNSKTKVKLKYQVINL